MHSHAHGHGHSALPINNILICGVFVFPIFFLHCVHIESFITGDWVKDHSRISYTIEKLNGCQTVCIRPRLFIGRWAQFMLVFFTSLNTLNNRFESDVRFYSFHRFQFSKSTARVCVFFPFKLPQNQLLHACETVN